MNVIKAKKAIVPATYVSQAQFVRGHSSFYSDDLKSIRGGTRQDGFVYLGDPMTPRFHTIRQAGECVSILLHLDDGSVAVGDCASVQYSGVGGRDLLFLATDFISFLEEHVRRLLEGLDVSRFYEHAEFFDALEVRGKRLPTAIRYGLTQALLEATALATRRTKVEVLCRERNLPIVASPIPLFGQCGDDRYLAVDRMILKGIDVLPHGLFNNIQDKLGYRGEKLEGYIQWLAKRIKILGDSTYCPDLHIDVFGTIGMIFDNDIAKVATYIAGLQNSAGQLNLYIEGPVDAGSKLGQIDAMAAVMAELDRLNSPVKIVADEWCNTLEDIVDFVDAGCCHMIHIKTPDLGGIQNTIDATLYCKKNGVEAYQGGTCNETDVSARTCVHVALAAQPSRLLVKPGMAFDEGMTIVYNEMHRTIAVLNSRDRSTAYY